MSKAIGLESARGQPRGKTSSLNAVFALFSMTLARHVQSRRILVLAALYALAIVFAVLFRVYDSGWTGPTQGYAPDFAEFLVIFNLIPQALLPLTALVYASGMIQDEIEEQTITYLLIRPLPRWSIYLAKFLATLVVTAGLTASFTALTYAVIGWDQPDYWAAGALGRMGKTIALFTLSLIAYDALFGALSMLMKRAILLGVGYIILLEGVVANIDFVIRKVTVMYYFRVLSERWMDLSKVWKAPGDPILYSIDFATAPSLRECFLTLSIASAVFIALSCYLMNSREFRVKTPEGN